MDTLKTSYNGLNVCLYTLQYTELYSLRKKHANSIYHATQIIQQSQNNTFIY